MQNKQTKDIRENLSMLEDPEMFLLASLRVYGKKVAD